VVVLESNRDRFLNPPCGPNRLILLGQLKPTGRRQDLSAHRTPIRFRYGRSVYHTRHYRTLQTRRRDGRQTSSVMRRVNTLSTVRYEQGDTSVRESRVEKHLEDRLRWGAFLCGLPFIYFAIVHASLTTLILFQSYFLTASVARHNWYSAATRVGPKMVLEGDDLVHTCPCRSHGRSSLLGQGEYRSRIQGILRNRDSLARGSSRNVLHSRNHRAMETFVREVGRLAAGIGS
jgi:hypothetical protein